MTKSDGKRVRRVVRSGYIRQMQHAPHHFHDLPFLGAAIADYALLDLERCILINRDAFLPACKQKDTPAVGNAYAGGDVRIEKQLFHGHGFRPEGIQQLRQVVVYDLQAFRKRETRFRPDRAVGQRLELSPLRFDHAKANDGDSGVQAQDPQVAHILPDEIGCCGG